MVCSGWRNASGLDPGWVWQSQADSSDGTVRVPPSTASDEPHGEWVPVHAQADESPKAIQHVEKLMKNKYGAIFYIFGFIGKMRGGAKYTAIKIQA